MAMHTGATHDDVCAGPPCAINLHSRACTISINNIAAGVVHNVYNLLHASYHLRQIYLSPHGLSDELSLLMRSCMPMRLAAATQATLSLDLELFSRGDESRFLMYFAQDEILPMSKTGCDQIRILRRAKK